MGAITHQLLPHDAGVGLPRRVREALNERAAACNRAAVAVNQAIALQVQSVADREIQAATLPYSPGAQPESTSPAALVVSDLEAAADSFHAQTLAVLSRAAARYAVYASSVAVEVAAARSAPEPDSDRIMPSDLITAFDMYLPEVAFPIALATPEAEDQNRLIRQARQHLRSVITDQIAGEQIAGYDDRATVAVDAGGPVGISAAFPEALHAYAATLAWAVAVHTRFDDQGDVS